MNANRNNALAPLLAQPAPAPVPTTDVPTATDVTLFSIFRTDVIHHLLDIFDEAFWKMYLMQAVHAYPAVWHAAIATAAAFNSLSATTGEAIEDSQLTVDRYRRMSLIHCNKAIQCLRQVNHTNLTQADREMLLIACMLLTYYSNLRGDNEQADMHMRNGVYLSKAWHEELQRRDTLVRRLPNCISPILSITLIFRRLEMELSLRPPFRPIEGTIEGDDTPAPERPFDSALESYTELIPFSVHLQRALRHVEPDGSIMAYSSAPGGLPCRNQYFRWSSRFELYYQNYLLDRKMGRVPPNEIVRAELMHIRWLTAEVTYLIDTSKEEMAWDEFDDSFRYILTVCERLLPHMRPPSVTDRRPRLVSPHSSIIDSALSRVISSCRNPKIRLRAVKLLESDIYLLGLGRTSETAESGLLMMRLEEDGWRRQPLPECYCIPGTTICNLHRFCAMRMRREEHGFTDYLLTCHDRAVGAAGYKVVLGPNKEK